VQRGPLSENNWTVTKRYSDFVALDSALRVSGIDLLLPPKKVFGNMDREFIAERKTGLQVI
jgi:PX domain-containing protein kinase-like protein